jgi:hypothetical protein
MTIKRLAGAVLKYSAHSLGTMLEIICDAMDKNKKIPFGHGRTVSGAVEPIVKKNGREVGEYSGERIL